MKTPTVLSILILAALTAGAVYGDPAPSFVLHTDNGKVAIDSLRGHIVYLDFWASWCDPCRESFPWMNDLQKKYGDQGLIVLAINLDKNWEKAHTFLEKHPASFQVAFDPRGEVAEKYKVKAMPNSYLIDRDGNIVETHLGFDKDQTPAIEKKIEELLKK